MLRGRAESSARGLILVSDLHHAFGGVIIPAEGEHVDTVKKIESYTGPEAFLPDLPEHGFKGGGKTFNQPIVQHDGISAAYRAAIPLIWIWQRMAEATCCTFMTVHRPGYSSLNLPILKKTLQELYATGRPLRFATIYQGQVQFNAADPGISSLPAAGNFSGTITLQDIRINDTTAYLYTIDTTQDGLAQDQHYNEAFNGADKDKYKPGDLLVSTLQPDSNAYLSLSGAGAHPEINPSDQDPDNDDQVVPVPDPGLLRCRGPSLTRRSPKPGLQFWI